jgi:hypothetical protein
MTPEQQDAYRSLIETRGRLPGPNKIYVHNPKLAKVMGPLGAHFRTDYSLSEREREILHRRGDDARLLRRPRRCPGNGPLTHRKR